MCFLVFIDLIVLGPLSTILFNIVVDMLAVIIMRAKMDDQITGVIPCLIEDGLSILQYCG